LAQEYGARSALPHPLLAPQYLDGGFASQPPIDPVMTMTTNTPSQLGIPSEGRITPLDRSATNSVHLVTPKISAERHNPHGRMAVESLLLNENAASAEGKREDDWVGENAAPALIVSPKS
jgi:hypothetical protein